jgi:hypothetical protein
MAGSLAAWETASPPTRRGDRPLIVYGGSINVGDSIRTQHCQNKSDFIVRIAALVQRARHRRRVTDSYRRVALHISDSPVWIA